MASNSINDEAFDLESALAGLRSDYSKLASRLRILNHEVSCDCDGVTLRLHFPAFRQGNATVNELVDVILHFLTGFALPRAQVKAVDDLYGKITVEEFKVKFFQLSEQAKSLFIRASLASNRNGEAGELILYILTEWILEAPQLIAKMSLKTNPDMPVHGSDGVHIRYSAKEARLLLYWGEAKLYAKVNEAISSAVTSICEALRPEKLQHEIDLVQRNIDFSGLDSAAKQSILTYLDPFDEAYNNRDDITTCLIGFDFSAYNECASGGIAQAEANFIINAQKEIKRLAPVLAKQLKKANAPNKPIEIFLLPVPSVQDLRDIFQNKIGWKQ